MKTVEPAQIENVDADDEEDKHQDQDEEDCRIELKMAAGPQLKAPTQIKAKG